MNRLSALFLLTFPVVASAQVTFTIDATGGGGLGTPLYTPQFVTIMVGDIVQWNGVSGTHNVYGELDDFPNNPEGFSSGQPQAAPWTYSKTFTLPGMYEFHCTQGSHSATQFGIITVSGINGLNDVSSAADEFWVYPVPAADQLHVNSGSSVAAIAEIIGMDGRLLGSYAVQDVRYTLDVAALPRGAYVLRVLGNDGSLRQRRFLKS